MENKEINFSNLVENLVASVPELMACAKCPENLALLARLRLIMDDLAEKQGREKLGDGAILAMLAKILPLLIQLLPLFRTPVNYVNSAIPR